MINFSLRNFTDIVFGKNQEEKAGTLIREFGGSKVLLHHCGEPFVLPLIERVKGFLEKSELAVVELAGVVPNPRIELVYDGVALCKKENVDFILAVGGGSVIDSAKAIAIGARFDGDVWDIYDYKAVPTDALPVGVISTFAGSGAESTAGSVITKGKIKRGIIDPDDKILSRPKFMILNPALTFTLNRHQTACGIIDIISHLTENYFTTNKDTEFAGNFITACLRTVIKFTPSVMENPEDYEARGALMMISSLAINGYSKVGRSGDWGCHEIEHETSGEWDIAHGAGIAILMPVWMRYVYKRHVEGFAKYATEVFDIPPDYENLEKTALAGIERFSAFIKDTLQLPSTFSELGVPANQLTDDILKKIADQVFFLGNKTVGRTYPIDTTDIFNILKQCV